MHLKKLYLEIFFSIKELSKPLATDFAASTCSKSFRFATLSLLALNSNSFGDLTFVNLESADLTSFRRSFAAFNS